jgi:hypothetical protein
VRDGQPELRCRFDAAQVTAAKAAVRASGIDAVADTPRGAHHDTATMTYRWDVPGSAGEVVDHAYPEVVPAAFDRLEAALGDLEDAAVARDAT